MRLSPNLRSIVTDASGRMESNISRCVHPTGSYGVTLLRVSYDDEVMLRGISTNHLIGVMDSQPVLTKHTMAGEHLEHQTGPGSTCIDPAGADYSVEFLGPVSGVVLEVNAECLAMVQAQSGSYHQRLLPDMNGFDSAMVRVTKMLELEADTGYPNGALLWSSAVDVLLRHLVEHCLGEQRLISYGMLSPKALQRVHDYVVEYMAESFDLAEMARIAECEKFRFARAFRKCVGVSPHRFVVRERVQRARLLIAEGRHTLAEIAAITGFSDQSHLHHWIKRICGCTPAQLASARGCKNLQDTVLLRA